MISITKDDVKEVAEGVAARNPGNSHVSSNNGSPCYYTYPDGSHCLVGAIAEGLGLPVPEFGDSVNSTGVEDFSLWVQQHSDYTLTDSAVNYLAELQNSADRGLQWDRVVARTH